MAAKIITLTGPDDVQLAVSVSGLDVTVSAGSFTCRGQALALAQDAVHTVVPDPTDAMEVCGSLAKDRDGGDAIVVMVGALKAGAPWDPGAWGGNYEVLCNLWRTQVPAAAGSLSEDDLICYRCVPE